MFRRAAVVSQIQSAIVARQNQRCCPVVLRGFDHAAARTVTVGATRRTGLPVLVAVAFVMADVGEAESNILSGMHEAGELQRHQQRDEPHRCGSEPEDPELSGTKHGEGT